MTTCRMQSVKVVTTNMIIVMSSRTFRVVGQKLTLRTGINKCRDIEQLVTHHP